MQAIGPLMVEHRLIERMILVTNKSLAKIEAENEVDLDFIDKAVDFIRVYADQTHHGKEEDILFRELDNKPLTEKDRKIMKDLIEEHVFARSTTKALIEANYRFRNGDVTALEEIAANLKIIIELYPRHIEKEDKVFFPSVRTYLTKEDDQTMLAEFQEFDQKMIHELYTSVVAGFETL